MDSIPLDSSQDNLTPETTWIYRLRDPETQEIRYVGKANDLQARYKQHLAHSSNQTKGTHTGHWIASLRKRGLKPVLDPLEEVPFAVWEEREQYWIEWHLQHGHPLTNTYFGGKGVGMVPPGTRAKMSASRIGRSPSPQAVAKSAASRRGKSMPPGHGEKVSAARKGKPGHPSTPETNAKISAAHTGKRKPPLSEEHRRKLGDANRGKQRSPETRRKIAASTRGRRHSPESLEKMRQAKLGNTHFLGRKHTPESIEKMRQAKLGNSFKRSAMRKNLPDAPSLWD